MGASDGTVQGITTLVNNGPNDQRHNIVFIAEGFTAAEQSDFNDHCDEIVNKLQSEAWFTELGSAINIHRLNVASDESGTDDPATCGDGSSGSGTSVATYFDSTFCNGGIRRCLSGDELLVRSTLDTQLAGWDTAAVLVNTSQRGGCASGNVFWASLSSAFRDVVVHELGHAAFDLADEYNYWEGCDSGETDRDNAPAGSDPGINVTSETERDLIKWRFFIEPTTPVPTMENPNCSECDERANVLSDDTIIGLYEGASYYHCGYYRPAYTCKMRQSGKEFCRVCVDGIAEELREFIPDEPTVEVLPTVLEFGDIAHNLTMYRSFEIRNIRAGMPVSVELDLGAIIGDPSFTYVPGTETSFRIPAPVFESYLSTTIFIAFTSSESGPPESFGSLQVTTPNSAVNLPVIVNLTGRAVEPPPIDSVLVIDRSDSMSGLTGIPGETKTDHAIDAAQLYVSLLKDNDRIGIVRYNDEARDPQDILLTMRLADSTGKSQASSTLTASNLDPDGFTSIGGGIILGSSVLDGGAADSRALVVLTDGIQNRMPDIPEATGVVQTKSPRQRVFSVGLGLNQLEDKLNQIASVTNGTAQITGDLVAQKEFLLQKLYVQILSDVSDEAFVQDPKALLYPGQQAATVVHLGEVDVSADFIVVFRRESVFPKYMDVWLEAPDGSIINSTTVGTMPNVQIVKQSGHFYYRVLFPIFPDLPQVHIGTWKVWVRNFSGHQVATTHVPDSYGGGVPLYYSVMAKARSDFRLAGRVEQATYNPASSMEVVLQPTLYGFPIELAEPVEVEVAKPDGSTRRLRLERDPECVYRGIFTETNQIGPYNVTVDVAAYTASGNYITRHRQMTGMIFVPGSSGGDDGGQGDDRIDELIEVVQKCCKTKVRQQDEIIKLLTELLKHSG
ncbi:MAG: M64 family metallopeptidase [Calothrix sp. MO_167.B12]|nr:M64 family metallopeptidase [Calothrix sp. MO_167.B12]